MSKRLGDISIASYRQRGYLSEAIVNYLALLGWSPGDTEEIFALEGLVERFSWERISVSPAIFDLERLNWFNKWYIRHLAPGRIAREAGPYLQEAYGRDERSQGTAYSQQEWRELLMEHVREEVSSLDEIPAQVGFVFLDEIAYTDKARKVLSAPSAGRVLASFVQLVNSLPNLDVAKARSLLQELRVNFEEMESFKAREVLFPIRASLTGALEGPSLAAVMALLGKDRCIQRVRSSKDSVSP